MDAWTRAINVRLKVLERRSETIDDAREAAETILANARTEADDIVRQARETVANIEAQLRDTRERFERLAGMQHDLQTNVRSAVAHFEAGLANLDGALPSVAPPAPARALVDVADAVELDRHEDAPIEAPPVTARFVRTHVETPAKAPAPRFEPRPMKLRVVTDEPTWPTSVVLDVSPLPEFSALADFERSVGELDVIKDVHVTSYHDGGAELMVRLHEGAPIAQLLRAHADLHAEVDDTRAERLRVTLS